MKTATLFPLSAITWCTVGLFSLPAVAQEIVPLGGGAPITSPIIQGFMTAAQQIARNLADSISGEMLTLLNYAFLIWLLIQVSFMMLGMGSGQAMFWNIVRRASIYFIIVFMLHGISTGQYWNWFVDEPIRVSSRLSSLAMNRSSSCSGDAVSVATCLARQIEMVFTQPMHASLVSMRSTPISLDSILSGAAVSQFLAGALLMLISFIGLVFFAFFILDVILRILVLAMFSPIFVAAFVFYPTRGWSSSAAWSLIGSIATLVGGAAALGVLEQTIARTLGAAGWDGIIAQITSSGGYYDSPINLDRVVFWQALFLSLVAVGVAKAISHMMASVFNSAPSGSPMADKASRIASIPIKAVTAGAVIGTGALAYMTAQGIWQGIRRGVVQPGGEGQDTVSALKEKAGRIHFGPGPLGGGPQPPPQDPPGPTKPGPSPGGTGTGPSPGGTGTGPSPGGTGTGPSPGTGPYPFTKHGGEGSGPQTNTSAPPHGSSTGGDRKDNNIQSHFATGFGQTNNLQPRPHEKTQNTSSINNPYAAEKTAETIKNTVMPNISPTIPKTEIHASGQQTIIPSNQQASSPPSQRDSPRRPRMGVSDYKRSFSWEVARKASEEAATAIDPTTNSGATT